MPAAAFYPLHFYGPFMTSMVVTDAAGSAQFHARQIYQPALTVGGIGTAQMRPYRGRRAALQAGGVGTLQATARKRVRAALTVTIGTLSQDDVTGAVLESEIEPGLTLRESVRLLLSVAVGKTDIVAGLGGAATVRFRNPADTADRVVATMDGSERAAVTLTP